MNTEGKTLGEVVESLEACGEALGQIYSTCCMSSRSQKMDEAFVSLQSAISAAKATRRNADNAQNCIDCIGEFGGKIGVLYATCCTAIREPLYRQIYHKLQQAHNGLWKLRGFSH